MGFLPIEGCFDDGNGDDDDDEYVCPECYYYDETAQDCKPSDEGTECSEEVPKNVCTDDECDGVGNCVHEAPEPTGEKRPCDDDNICTVDTCDEDIDECVNEWIPECCLSDKHCDDGNPCTDNLCNLEINECVYETDDTNICGEQRTCFESKCVSKNYYIYPESGHDYCLNGDCMEYSCKPKIEVDVWKCRDDDRDGVKNEKDKCPRTKGGSVKYGCSCNQKKSLRQAAFFGVRCIFRDMLSTAPRS